MKIALLVVLFMLSAVCSAQDSGEVPKAPDTPPGLTEETSNILDQHKQAVDARIMRASEWVDSFFADPAYEAENATTLIRIRPGIYYRKEQGTKGKLKVGIKLNLPNLGHKTSLVIGNDDSIDDFDDSVDDSTDESVVGLQFFGRSSTRWYTSLSAGLKFNEFAGYVGPRVRYLAPWGDHRSISFTQAVRYQTNGYWNTVSRMDFNFVLSDWFYFRQTFDGRFRGERKDDEGFRTRVSSILTQRLNQTAGLQYDFSTILHTSPDNHVDRYTLSVRYRKRTSRDWLYYEIVPQVSFDHDYDFVFNPGIRLRVEFFYGATSGADFSKRQIEDTDEFRW